MGCGASRSVAILSSEDVRNQCQEGVTSQSPQNTHAPRSIARTDSQQLPVKFRRPSAHQESSLGHAKLITCLCTSHLAKNDQATRLFYFIVSKYTRLFLPNMVFWWVIGSLRQTLHFLFFQIWSCCGWWGEPLIFYEGKKSDQGGNQKQLIIFVWPYLYNCILLTLFT